MRITKEVLNNKIAYTSEVTGKEIINRIFNGYNHLYINSEIILGSTNKECADFLMDL